MAMFKLLLIRPVAYKNHPSGLARASMKIVGVRKRRIGATSRHFSPSNTRTTSSAKTNDVNIMGRIKENSTE